MTKKSKVYLIVAIALVTTFIVLIMSNSQNNNKLPKLAITQLPQAGSGGNISELKLATELPIVPEKLMVYKVKKPNLTVEKVRETARKLGIEGAVKESAIDLRVRSDKGEYIIDKATGNESFMTKEFALQHEPVTTVLSDEEYKNLASQFLHKAGLMKDKAVFVDVNKGNTVTAIDENGVERTKPHMIEVRFGRENLNNLAVRGVGPKISVYFGDKKQIIGTKSVWCEVEPYLEYPVVAPAQGIEQVKKNDAVVFNVNRSDTVTVKEIKLTYIVGPIGSHQEFIIPHYVMTGTNTAGKQFTALTRAIAREYFKD